MQDRQQHVRGPLRVVRKHKVSVSLERPVYAAEQDDRHLYMRVTVRVAHVAALVDQNMVEQSAVTFLDLRQLRGEVRQILHMVTVHFCVVGDILRFVTQ